MILFAAVFVFTFLLTYAIAFRHHPMLEPITEAVANLRVRIGFEFECDITRGGLGIIYDTRLHQRSMVALVVGPFVLGVTYERV